MNLTGDKFVSLTLILIRKQKTKVLIDFSSTNMLQPHNFCKNTQIDKLDKKIEKILNTEGNLMDINKNKTIGININKSTKS